MKIKRCPFCGCKGKIRRGITWDNTRFWWVECDARRCPTNPTTWRAWLTHLNTGGRADPINAWNRRAQ